MHHHLLTNHRFFSSPPWPLKVLGIYIWGDALIIIPLWGIILAFALIDHHLGIRAIISLYGARALGEMVYWIHQQFGPRTYRPCDFGLTHLDTHAIYILYQLANMAQLIIALILASVYW